MQIRHFLLGVLIAAVSNAALACSASAGEWAFGCGACSGGYGSGQVLYAAPTYSYAPPTVTVVPHYIVQPNYVVERTYVVRPTQYIAEGTPCFQGCGERYVVNQGQYDTPYFSGAIGVGYGFGHRHHRHGYYNYGHRGLYRGW
jgi:hypothetical protein